MNNFMDKMKQVVFPLLDKYKNYISVCGLFVLMVVVLFYFTGEEYIANRQEAENNKTVSGADYIPADGFDIDAHVEVNELIKTYFEAYVNADFEALATVATPLSDMEKSYITTMSQHYEEYRNIKCYTKQGLSKNSYIVSVCFDIKFVDQEVLAPSMLMFYVQTNEEGHLYINNLYSDFNQRYHELTINKDVLIALRKYTTHDDYISLYMEVDNAFDKLIKENEAIYNLTKSTIPAMRKEWEDNVYYVHDTETGTENATGTESAGTEDAGTEVAGTESTTENAGSTESSTQVTTQ